MDEGNKDDEKQAMGVNVYYVPVVGQPPNPCDGWPAIP